MKCKICDTKVIELFSKKILNKYDIKYFQCPSCNFIQTEKPYWLNEAYSEAISVLDTGILRRNLELANKTSVILRKNFNNGNKYLDWAAGYGILVRWLRDNGFNFYSYDKYCENLFAKTFDLTTAIEQNKELKFELVTAFEVFEHLENPIEEIKRMLKYSKSILFSTLLIPNPKKEIKDWWYITPESGQHISFYSLKSLHAIAKKLDLKLYSDQHNLHLLTKRKIKNKTFLRKRNIFNQLFNYMNLFNFILINSFRSKSLTMKDRDMISKEQIIGSSEPYGIN